MSEKSRTIGNLTFTSTTQDTITTQEIKLGTTTLYINYGPLSDAQQATREAIEAILTFAEVAEGFDTSKATLCSADHGVTMGYNVSTRFDLQKKLELEAYTHGILVSLTEEGGQKNKKQNSPIFFYSEGDQPNTTIDKDIKRKYITEKELSLLHNLITSIEKDANYKK